MTERIKFSQLIFNESCVLDEELYKSIVIDRKNRDFKIITGDFDSKKSLIDFYDSDYIVKRVFLKDVFDWIPKHAKTALDAYLMYSIAVSKWKNNNMLKDYYEQLIIDVPDAANLDEGVGGTTMGSALQKETEDPIITDRIYARKNECGNYSIYQSKDDMNNNQNPLFELTEEEFADKTKDLPADLIVDWATNTDEFKDEVLNWLEEDDGLIQSLRPGLGVCFECEYNPAEPDVGIMFPYSEVSDYRWDNIEFYLREGIIKEYPALKDYPQLVDDILAYVIDKIDFDKFIDRYSDEICQDVADANEPDEDLYRDEPR